MTKSRLLGDPWRIPGAPAPPKEKPAIRRPAPKVPPKHKEDIQEEGKFATLEITKYGGITLDGGESPTQVALAVLEFCRKHADLVDPILTDHGVLVTQLQHRPSNLIFYVQRGDGWILAVPDVPSREAGCIQLIQALLEIQRNPKLKTLMASDRLRVYKM